MLEQRFNDGCLIFFLNISTEGNVTTSNRTMYEAAMNGKCNFPQERRPADFHPALATAPYLT